MANAGFGPAKRAVTVDDRYPMGIVMITWVVIHPLLHSIIAHRVTKSQCARPTMLLLQVQAAGLLGAAHVGDQPAGQHDTPSHHQEQHELVDHGQHGHSV